MAQVNHNYAYVRDVDGQTVWERLRVIRNFLTDRRKALKVTLLSKEKFEVQKETMDKWERKEAEILNEDQDELIQDCIDEIAFLEEFEALLMIEAEKERVPGKTDREMYEINWVKESRVRLLEEVRAQVISLGHVNTETMKTLMREPEVVGESIRLGLIRPEAVNMISESNPKLLGLLNEAFDSSTNSFIEHKA